MPAAAIQGHQLVFYCPGCDRPHAVNVQQPPSRDHLEPVWQWNGDLYLPTLYPSVGVRWTHGPTFLERRCHLFVRAGQAEFLADCTHELAGRTVSLPTMEW
jgi:hypothetical protein